MVILNLYEYTVVYNSVEKKGYNVEYLAITAVTVGIFREADA